jgi:hypothetical protein
MSLTRIVATPSSATSDQLATERQLREAAERNVADMRQQLESERRAVQAATNPLPKARVYPDKTDAKEALENLHDVLVKRVQPAIATFPRIDVFTLQRSLEQAVRNRFSIADRPGQTERPDPKVVRTEGIKNFLNNQLLAITDANTKLQDAIGSIYGIRAKQKAITMGNTEEFFTLAYPPQTFADAQGYLVMSFRYFLKQDTLETDLMEVMKANYVVFENQRGLYERQIGDAVHRAAEEISAIETK